jgi:hypothetical protein
MDGSNEIALLYFSGHGFINSIGGYIVTPDYKQYDEGISMDEILILTNNSRTKDRIVILDCCHSGAFGSPTLTGNQSAMIGEGVTILTATRDSEAAIEINGHGLFTSLLIDSLNGGAADLKGSITPGSVYAYIDRALGSWEQRPVFKTNVTRFTSLRTAAPPIELEKLRRINELFPDADRDFLLDKSYEDTEKGYDSAHVALFKILQKYERVGLVVPVGEEHMYYAAIHNKACRLSALGKHYWRLVRDHRV